MKNILTIFFLITLNLNVFSQFQLNIAEYPKTKIAPKSKEIDFSKYELLKKDGLPRKAFEELKRLEVKALTEKNTKAYWKILSEIQSIVEQAQYENEEQQKIIWDYAQQAEKLEFPFNNMLHFHLKNWMSLNRWNEFLFTFDDESLLWPIDGKNVKLTNGDLSVLINYHQKMVIDKPTELMKIELNSILEKDEISEPKSMESLFEYFAFSIINETEFYSLNINIKDSLYYGYTDELPTAKDFYEPDYFTFQLYYHLEKLTLTNKRFDTYAYWVGKRLNLVCQFSTSENINEFEKERLLNDAFLRFEELLIDSKASALFTLQIANNLAQKAINFDWKNNIEPEKNNLLAFNKIDISLKKYPESDFKNELTNLKNYILSEELNFSIKNHLEVEQAILLNVHYRNTKRATFKIFKICIG